MVDPHPDHSLNKGEGPCYCHLDSNCLCSHNNSDPTSNKRGCRHSKRALKHLEGIISCETGYDSHIQNVCAHNRDPAICKEKTLNNKHQCNDQNTCKRAAKNYCCQDTTKHMTACSPWYWYIHGLNCKDSC